MRRPRPRSSFTPPARRRRVPYHRYNAIVESGIEIVNRVEIPPEMVPKDAQVEIAAKVFHGYHAGAGYAGMDEKRLDGVVGREYVPDPSAQRVA